MIHLFVIAKDGACSTLGAFIDRQEGRKVYAQSKSVAGVYTSDSGAVLSTVDMPSEGQLRALKAFALATLTGTAPTLPPPASPAPRVGRPVKRASLAAQAARLDEHNAGLRVARMADARRVGLAEAARLVEIEDHEPDALAAGPEDFGGTDFPDEVAAAIAVLGIGATTEPPPAPVAEAPLPAPWDAPVVEAPSELARVQALLVDETARRVAVESERDTLALVAADVVELRERVEALNEEVDDVRSDLGDERAAHALAREQRDTALATVALRQRDCDARDRELADLRAALGVEREALDASRAALARVEAERDALDASLRERSAQVDALRRATAPKIVRTRTIAPKRVRKAPPPVHPIAALADLFARRAAR